MPNPIWQANDKYEGFLQTTYNPGDVFFALDNIPLNVPTIVVSAPGTIYEAVFAVTDKTINALTGVTRLRGFNGVLVEGTVFTCLNNEEFINQYSTLVGGLFTVPDGGTTNQVLRKKSGTDNDTEWHTPAKADVGLSNVDNTSNLSLLALVYPIGCIYTETTGTSPGTTFGFGTWSAYGAGRVMVSKAASGTFNTAGATGGEETHTLTGAESGQSGHNHTQNSHYHATNAGNAVSGTTRIAGSNSTSIGVVNTGTTIATNQAVAAANATNAHNNLQPYIVVFVWTRTA